MGHPLTYFKGLNPRNASCRSLLDIDMMQGMKEDRQVDAGYVHKPAEWQLTENATPIVLFSALCKYVVIRLG